MGIFNKIKEPKFLKNDSSAQKQLQQLKALLSEVPDSLRPQLEREIKAVSAGIYGEDQVAYELKTSHIPMLILRDLCLQSEDLTAQIDFLIITRKCIFVIECKNLTGNIEVSGSGDFIRIPSRYTKSGASCINERIYSPITQNKKHLDLIKKLRRESQKNFLSKFTFEKNFDKYYRSVVVLSNPKTVLNFKDTKEEIRRQVIHADQLIDYIEQENAAVDSASESSMMELGRFFLGLHCEIHKDYTKKYKAQISSRKPFSSKAAVLAEQAVHCPRCGAPMIRRKASRGANAGREFWGCSNFPECKGTVSISSPKKGGE